MRSNRKKKQVEQNQRLVKTQTKLDERGLRSADLDGLARQGYVTKHDTKSGSEVRHGVALTFDLGETQAVRDINTGANARRVQVAGWRNRAFRVLLTADKIVCDDLAGGSSMSSATEILSLRRDRNRAA